MYILPHVIQSLHFPLGMYWIQIFEIQPEMDVAAYLPVYIWPELELASVTAAVLLCMLTMCTKLHNLCINCSVLMSVIAFVLSLLHIVMHNICLFECQLVTVSYT